MLRVEKSFYLWATDSGVLGPEFYFCCIDAHNKATESCTLRDARICFFTMQRGITHPSLHSFMANPISFDTANDEEASRSINATAQVIGHVHIESGGNLYYIMMVSGSWYTNLAVDTGN